jgi:Tfp pilus assembly protein PilX
MKPHNNDNRRGGALIIALVTLLVVMLMAGAIVRSLVADHRETRQAAKELQAHCLADAAAARGAAMLRMNSEYVGETWRAEIATDDTGVAEIRVQRPGNGNNPTQLTIEARYPDHAWRRIAVSRSILVGQASSLPRPTENNP